MPEKELPARPNLEQYKKQAKDLARDCAAGDRDALARVQRHHPRFTSASHDSMGPVALTDAQLVIAREHGLESWPKFAAHITTLNLERSVAGLDDPVNAFLRAASASREISHTFGTLEEAELILTRHPHVARANIHTAAVLGDEDGVRTFLAQGKANASAKGGPYE